MIPRFSTRTPFLERTLFWAHAYLSACFFERMLFWAHTFLSACFFDGMLFWVYAFLSLCFFERMLFWAHNFLSAWFFWAHDFLSAFFKVHSCFFERTLLQNGQTLTECKFEFVTLYKIQVWDWTYELSGGNGNIFDFSPSHQQVIPNCRRLPGVNLEWIVRSREDTMTLVMECDRSAKQKDLI